MDIPVLYLSRYIVQTKSEYYRLLQSVREEGNGEAFLDYKHRIREKHKFYRQDLINNLFMHPYTKIEFVERDLGVSRLTATRYLDLLAKDGFLDKQRAGRYNYYVNTALFAILVQSDG